MSFLPVDVRETGHPVRRLADEWALLSAGTPEHWNGMTVSWGGIGELWGFDVAFVFVRPQRYTLEFMEAQPFFSLSFGLPRKMLGVCGKLSGRDGNKLQEAGIATAGNDLTVWPQQAETVLVCRKAAWQDLDPKGFLLPEIAGNYPENDYHRMFVGKIEQCLQAQS